MIYIFRDNAEKLRPIVERWRQECNAEKFGLKEDFDTFIADLQQLIDDKDKDLIVLENDGKIIGLMGVVLFKSSLGDNLIANEHFYYVQPEYRGVSSIRLLRAFESYAKSRGCSHILMNASRLASNLFEKVCEIYKKNNMLEFERVYVKEI